MRHQFDGVLKFPRCRIKLSLFEKDDPQIIARRAVHHIRRDRVFENLFRGVVLSFGDQLVGRLVLHAGHFCILARGGDSRTGLAALTYQRDK